MSPTDLAVQEQQAASNRQRVVNDFSIQIATVNGSGSQTANMVLLRSILLMGVPVSGKNVPRNRGLPRGTRFREQRNYIARREVDLLVAMNAETQRKTSSRSTRRGRIHEPMKLNAPGRPTSIGAVDKLLTPVVTTPKLRRLVRNRFAAFLQDARNRHALIRRR